MTKAQKADMYAAIEAHGQRLNAIFNTGLEPIVLCKKLFRLENAAARLTEQTATYNTDNEEKLTKLLTSARKILFPDAPKDLRDYAKLPLWLAVQINHDPRGNALKIFGPLDLDLPRDAGGHDYIIAPDFSN